MRTKPIALGNSAGQIETSKQHGKLDDLRQS